MNFTQDEIKLLSHALTTLANNIRYSLRDKPAELSKQVEEVEALNRKVICENI